jgi:hypothetical protein
MINRILLLVMCHMIGDYVLQSDFIAKTKGENWYHLFVHCVLYCVPFAVIFGINELLAYIFVQHFIIDSLKARHKIINYITDQILHYLILLIYVF